MTDFLKNKKIIAIVGLGIITIIVAVIIFFITSSQNETLIDGVFLTAGGAVSNDTYQSRGGATEEDKAFSAQIEIPLTVKLASQSGWSKATECIPGHGIYYKKTDMYPLMTIYDFDGNLIGLYQFSDNKMSSPWEETNGPSKLDGTPIVSKLHYGVYLFLLDPTNACDSGTKYESVYYLSSRFNPASPSSLPSYSIPDTGALAIEQGWVDQAYCSQGRGKYFTKADEDYLLMYNAAGIPIGIYQQSFESMDLPWRKIPKLVGGGGLDVIAEEHYGMFIYFGDNIRACKSGEAAAGSGSPYGGPASAARSTPTPYVEPTATPLPTGLLTTAATQLSSASNLKVTVTTDPENITVASEADISANVSGLSDIISNLTEVTYASNTWIDNVSYKGVSGSYTAKGLDALVPGAVEGNVVKASVWVSDEGAVKRVRLEGALTSDDSDSAIRTFDITK